jgi:hypothetical protein
MKESNLAKAQDSYYKALKSYFESVEALSEPTRQPSSNARSSISKKEKDLIAMRAAFQQVTKTHEIYESLKKGEQG